MTSSLGAAVAAYRLPSRLELPGTPLDDGCFDALVEECVSQRVLGLLWAAVLRRGLPDDRRAARPARNVSGELGRACSAC